MEKENSPELTRRNFITKFVMSGGLIAGAVLLLRNSLSFIFPKIEPPPLRKLLIGKVGDLQPGQAQEIPFGESTLFLINTKDGYKVFSSVCTHLGCKINWESYRSRFFCPCHKGIFNESGEVVEGPPPRPLDEFKVEIDKNLIYMWIEEKRGGLS